MSTDSDHGDLPVSQQTQNVLLYALNVALLYLASPVVYVGTLQAVLVNKLNFPNWVANLPGSVYQWATPLPVLVTWYFPQIRLLKRLVIGSFLVVALMGAVTTVVVGFLGPG